MTSRSTCATSTNYSLQKIFQGQNWGHALNNVRFVGQCRPDLANPANAGTATASRIQVLPTRCRNVKLGFALFRHTWRPWSGLPCNAIGLMPCLMVDFGVRWAFLPVGIHSDKNVQPTYFLNSQQQFCTFWLNSGRWSGVSELNA